MAAFKAFWNSPVGPKTTHFWGPVANWGFVAAVSFIPMIICLLFINKVLHLFNSLGFKNGLNLWF